MPIRREYRWFYPIDWPQLSAAISCAGAFHRRSPRALHAASARDYHSRSSRPEGVTLILREEILSDERGALARNRRSVRDGFHSSRRISPFEFVTQDRGSGFQDADDVRTIFRRRDLDPAREFATADAYEVT
jgi:hypothetical protein